MKAKPKKSAKPAPRAPQRKAAPKKIQKDVTPQNEVKEMFLSWFKKHKQVGQIMTKQQVVGEIIKKLDAKQNDALEDAMKELVESGVLEVQEDGVTLILTAKGVERLS